MEVLIILILLLALGIAACHWGVNSTDGPTSPEWERRNTIFERQRATSHE